MNEDLFIFCLVRVVAIISLESHSYISNSDRLTAQKIKAKKIPWNNSFVVKCNVLVVQQHEHLPQIVWYASLKLNLFASVHTVSLTVTQKNGNNNSSASASMVGHIS